MKKQFSNKSVTEHLEESKSSLNLFKNLKVPNLEKLINSSHEIYSDFLTFAGELWNKDHHKIDRRPQKSLDSSESSVIYEEPSSSDIIILHRQSVQSKSQLIQIKPIRQKNSKSVYVKDPQKVPHLQIDEDIQPQIANVRNQSMLENSQNFRHDSHLNYPLSQFSLDIPNRPSNGLKINSSILKNSINLGESVVIHEDIGKKNYVNSVHFDIKSGIESPRDQEMLEYKDSEKFNENRENNEQKWKNLGKKQKIQIKIETAVENSEELDKPNSPSNKTINKKSEQDTNSLKFPSARHSKSPSTPAFVGIPKIFRVRHNSENMGPSTVKDIFDIRNILETSEDLPEELKEIDKVEDEQEMSYSKSNSSQSSTAQLYTLIPKSILYQIPVLTFEEFINSLINHDMSQNKEKLWKNNFFSFFCCKKKLSQDDLKISENLIRFSLMEFNFKNSFHLILLLSCFNSVTKSEKWPHRDEDWYNMGFQTNDIEKELQNHGNIALLHIFFLSTYFPKFLADVLKVRRYYFFDFYEIVAALSKLTIKILRKQKLNKLIHSYGRGLEVIFFFFAGIMLFWFKQLVKCKDFIFIYNLTVEKAQNSMNELLEEAWNLYINITVEEGGNN